MVKSSAYPPLLDGLLDLACRDGVDIRPTLLRVLTDLYVQKPAHTAEEETQYVELASGLIDVVDDPTRATVAGKLCAYASAPLAIRQRLAEHGAMPAPNVAETTPNITDDAPDHVSLSRCRDLVELFFAASAGDRCLILGNLDVLNEPEHAAPISREMSRQLEAAALQRRTPEFTRLLGHALGINPALAERVTRDSSGEPIVIAAKALGMPAAVLQRILLFLNPAVGQSIERVHSLSQLYEELATATAARMVAIWRQAGGVRHTVHAPVLWDDEQRSARAAATPARHSQPHREALPLAWQKSRDRA